MVDGNYFLFQIKFFISLSATLFNKVCCYSNQYRLEIGSFLLKIDEIVDESATTK